MIRLHSSRLRVADMRVLVLLSPVIEKTLPGFEQALSLYFSCLLADVPQPHAPHHPDSLRTLI